MEDQGNRVYLEMENFKSFSGLPKLNLNGTSVLFGDNGLGKTNIFEALLFVLGASPKDLRVKTYLDLINNQSSTEMCKVKLIINQQEFIRMVEKNQVFHIVDGCIVSRIEYNEKVYSSGLDLKAKNFYICQGKVGDVFFMNKQKFSNWLELLAGTIDLKDEENRLSCLVIPLKEKEYKIFNELKRLLSVRSEAKKLLNLQAEKDILKEQWMDVRNRIKIYELFLNENKIKSLKDQEVITKNQINELREKCDEKKAQHNDSNAIQADDMKIQIKVLNQKIAEFNAALNAIQEEKKSTEKNITEDSKRAKKIAELNNKIRNLRTEIDRNNINHFERDEFQQLLMQFSENATVSDLENLLDPERQFLSFEMKRLQSKKLQHEAFADYQKALKEATKSLETLTIDKGLPKDLQEIPTKLNEPLIAELAAIKYNNKKDEWRKKNMSLLKSKVPGVIGRISDLVKVKSPEHFKAMRSVFGDFYYSILVDNYENALKCYHIEEALGETYLMLDKVKHMQDSQLITAIGEPLIDFLEFEENIKGAVVYLCKNTLIVDTAEDSEALLTEDINVVSKDGVFVGTNDVRNFVDIPPSGKNRLKQLQQQLDAENDSRLSIANDNIQAICNKVEAEVSQEILHSDEFKELFDYIKNEERKLPSPEERQNLSRNIAQLSQQLQRKETSVSNLMPFRVTSYMNSDLNSAENSELSNVISQRSALLQKTCNVDELKLKLESLNKQIKSLKKTIQVDSNKLRKLEQSLNQLLQVEDVFANECKIIADQMKDALKNEKQILRMVSKLQEKKRRLLAEAEIKEENLPAKFRTLGTRANHENISSQMNSLQQKEKSLLLKVKNFKTTYEGNGESYEEIKQQVVDCNKRLSEVREKLESCEPELDRVKKERSITFNNFLAQLRNRMNDHIRFINDNDECCVEFRCVNPLEPYTDEISLWLYLGKNKLIPCQELSGGERTIFSVVLILSLVDITSTNKKIPPLIMFDEVDAFLDANNCKLFNQMIGKLKLDSSLLIISHKGFVTTDQILLVAKKPAGQGSLVAAVDLTKFPQS